MTREEAVEAIKEAYGNSEYTDEIIKALEQEPFINKPCVSEKVCKHDKQMVLDKINKMKSEIADSLEFWDYSPNNNPLARDMLETLTNFWGDIKAEVEPQESEG